MPPKRGTKRKAAASSNSTGDGDAIPSTPLDRATWQGWVEMESEPAFFNVMLKDMGVRGVKVQEIYSLEDYDLALLPQPVHALIFLFRYRETEKEDQGTHCPDHVWFANQTPDFACASFALLNIINNIPGLHLGKELRTFKDFTQDMDPLSRGDAVDSFDFVKRIHNSFARENDLLQVDMHLKSKADKFHKRQALAKARETREAKKAAKTPKKTPVKETAVNEVTPARSSNGSAKSTPKKSPKKSSKKSILEDDPDGDFGAPAKSKTQQKEQTNGARRSNREPKPRADKISEVAAAEPTNDEGFHFIAYIPIKGHVWKLDGLDRFPQDMGSFSEDEGGNWMTVAQLALMGLMAQYNASNIEVNLMAIVHDPLGSDRAALLGNVKTLQAADQKLDEVYDDWRSLEGAETKKEVIVNTSLELGITAGDVDAAEAEAGTLKKIEEEDDLLKLVEIRRGIIKQQAGLRATVRDSVEATKGDEEKAFHRRHDYGTFVRSWLNALAEQEILKELVDG